MQKILKTNFYRISPRDCICILDQHFTTALILHILYTIYLISFFLVDNTLSLTKEIERETKADVRVEGHRQSFFSYIHTFNVLEGNLFSIK